jgi:hypothetical protein
VRFRNSIPGTSWFPEMPACARVLQAMRPPATRNQAPRFADSQRELASHRVDGGTGVGTAPFGGLDTSVAWLQVDAPAEDGRPSSLVGGLPVSALDQSVLTVNVAATLVTPGAAAGVDVGTTPTTPLRMAAAANCTGVNLNLEASAINALNIGVTVQRCQPPQFVCNECGQVTELHLAGMRISGSIPGLLRNLRALTVLDLSLGTNYWSENKLFRSIPPELSECSQLQVVSLAGSLTGTLATNFSSWTQLHVLDVSGSLVSGTLSPEFSSWTQLQRLRVSSVSGVIHEAFSSWTQLRELQLDDGTISGTLSPAFSCWTLLETFSINSKPLLSGTLAPEFAAWRQLSSLSLLNTGISGTIHSEFAAWTQLQQLILSRTRISGSLSPSFSSWTKLRNLLLGGTRVSGVISDAFSLWPIMQLNLSASAFSGTIPTSLSNWTQLNNTYISMFNPRR